MSPPSFMDIDQKALAPPYIIMDHTKLAPPQPYFRVEASNCIAPGEEILLPSFISVPAKQQATMIQMVIDKAMAATKTKELLMKEKAVKKSLKKSREGETLGYTGSGSGGHAELSFKKKKELALRR
ncbi:hypothetical protein L218DRAFT_1006673 [Marasmius fiardii PR-910]|nr:hypothetical protein L218DRAFT_1006673 [Marasmius fiardii PR-910]